MAQDTSSQYNQNSGQGAGSVGQGVGRDVNASLGKLEIAPDLSNFMRDFGSAKSAATSTSGAVTVGDRIIGGNKSSRQFGIVKILALFGACALLFKLYKKMKG